MTHHRASGRLSDGLWMDQALAKAEENPHLREADTFGIFCRLLMMASRQDRDVFVSKLKRVIKLKRGQLWVSTVDLAGMVVLSNGEATLGLPGGPFWTGEQCLQRLDTQRRERAA